MSNLEAPKSPQPVAPAQPDRSRRSFLLKRLMPLLIIALLATWFFRRSPESTELVYGLGPKSQNLQQLVVELHKQPDDTLVRHAEYYYSSGSPAPAEQPQPLKLESGSRYEIDATLVYPDRRETVTRQFTYQGEMRTTVRM